MALDLILAEGWFCWWSMRYLVCLALLQHSVKGGGIVDHCGGRKVYHLA